VSGSGLHQLKERLKEADENHGMPLTAALGRRGTNGAWYMDKDGVVKDQTGRDVWGNPDPRRHERHAHRVTSNDPLAFMKQAQRQLKEVSRDRQEREAELDQLRARVSREESEFANFSLDGPALSVKGYQPHKKEGSHRRRDQSKSRDKSKGTHRKHGRSRSSDAPSSHSHARRRSQSAERDRLR